MDAPQASPATTKAGEAPINSTPSPEASSQIRYPRLAKNRETASFGINNLTNDEFLSSSTRNLLLAKRHHPCD
jgi:hypothetical protein